MILRLVNILRRGLLLLMFGVLMFVIWVINSESGLRWTLQRVQPYLPGELQLENVSGRLSGPINIETLQYRQDGLALESRAIVLNWSPTALAAGQLRFSELSADEINIQLPETETPASGAETTPRGTPSINLPLVISLGALDIGRLQVNSASKEIIQIDSIRSTAQLRATRLQIDQLQLNTMGTEINANGHVDLQQHYPHDIRFNWRMAQTPVGAGRGAGQLQGDLINTRLNHTISAPVSAELALTLSDVMDQPHWQGHLNVKPVNLQSLATTLPPFTIGLKTELSGDLQQQQASGNFTSNSAALGPMNGAFRLSHSSATLWIEELMLASTLQQRGARALGYWQYQSNHGEFALNWQDLSWPWQGDVHIHSAIGSAYLKGSPDDYLLHFAADLDTPHWEDGQLSGIGHGSLAGIDFNTARLLTIDGEISGNVLLDWRDDFSWKTSLQGKRLDPGQRWQSWPGRINFTVDSEGSTGNDLRAALNIRKLDGNLRGYPVDMHGHLSWQDETLTLFNVQINSADSQIRADGNVGKQLGLEWMLTSENLTELHPDFRGKLITTGLLSDTLTAPRLTLKLQGSELGWRDQYIDHINAEGDLDLANWQASTLRANAQGLAMFDQNIESVDLKLTVTEQKQQHLELTAVHPQATLALEASGGMQATGWRGHLNDLRLHSRMVGDWRLRSAVSLLFEPETMHVDPLCLGNLEQSLCLSLSRQQQQWSLMLHGDQLSLAQLSPLLPERMDLRGNTTLNLQATLDPDSRLTAQGELVLSAGHLDFPLVEGETASWEFRGGRIDLDLDPRGLLLKAHLAINDQDFLRANAALPGIDPFKFDAQTQTIDASLALAFSDLALIQSLIFETQDVQGRLNLNTTLKGPLRAPQINGKLELANGALRLPRFGLAIDKISLTANSVQDAFDYNLSARSGDGTLKLTGNTTVDPAAGWPTVINIKGDNVEAVHIPEARVTISPDVTIKIKGRRIDTQGVVVIPYAKLQPKDISTAVLPSDDIEFLGARAERVDKWLLYSQVRLILGERVTLYGYGFDGRIDGNLLLTDEPNAPTIGNGELNVPEGRYQAYGQDLTIERGRLLFASSPVNNPGLDLRAVRKVQDVTAGVSVSGTLRSPAFEIYSVPAMEQTDALSYLVLGRPYDETSEADKLTLAQALIRLGLKGGDVLARQISESLYLDVMRIEASSEGDQASLVMGRYLSPRLYVSYGVGLIQSFNTINLRYQISDKWQLTAESGVEQGADIIYTIER